jgi:hypothetical protein
MFTQKLLKDYAMVGMGNSFGNPKKDLQHVISSFEESMKLLSNYTKDKPTSNSIKEAQKLWISIKEKLSQKPIKQRAPKLQQELENLLKVSDNTTKLFAKQTKEQSGEIINISGRQRMLSQKMASLYMLRVWGIEDEKFSKKMSDSMELFKSSLEKLTKYEKNTTEISALLKKVKRSFMFFEIMNRSKSKFIPSLIYKKSNDILNNMNKITALYAEQKVN